MHMLILGFAVCTYHIVGNLMLWLSSVNHVFKQQIYKEIIIRENDHIIVIFLEFFFKILWEKIGSHNMTVFCPNTYHNEVHYKGTVL